MSAIRTFLYWLGFHQHAWGIWYRSIARPGEVIETCYECGKERVVKVRFDK